MFLNRTAICILGGVFILFSSFFVLVSFSDIASLAPDSFKWEQTEGVADAAKPVDPAFKPGEGEKDDKAGGDGGKTATAGKGKPSRSPGCGKEHDWVGQEHREFKIKSGGRERTYYVLLPRGYKPDKEMAALVMFSPKNTEGLRFDRFTGFSNPLVNPHMITVYPVAIDLSWEGAPSAPKGVDDLTFASDLLEALKDEYCIKQDQVFATGHSNGAGFVNYLACSEEHGKGFLAFAPVAGTFYTDVKGDEGCDASERVRPMLEVHGDGDEWALYDGGMKDGQPIPSIPGWIERWTKRNKCDEEPAKKEDKDGKIDTSYTCQGVAGAVRHIVLKGANHGWPGIDGDGKFMKNWITPTLVDWFFDVTYKPSIS